MISTERSRRSVSVIALAALLAFGSGCRCPCPNAAPHDAVRVVRVLPSDPSDGTEVERSAQRVDAQSRGPWVSIYEDFFRDGVFPWARETLDAAGIPWSDTPPHHGQAVLSVEADRAVEAILLLQAHPKIGPRVRRVPGVWRLENNATPPPPTAPAPAPWSFESDATPEFNPSADRARTPDLRPNDVVGTGSLVVTVVAKDGGAPVSNAVVQVWSDERRWTVTTDATGTVNVVAIPKGYVDVRADATGWVGEESGVTIDAGYRSDLELALGPGVPFVGEVVSEETGAPIAGVEIVVEATGDAVPRRQVPYARQWTDAAGRFQVGGVPDPEVVSVHAKGEGHPTMTASVTVQDGKASPAVLTMRLPPGGEVRGVVRGSDGKPVDDATVVVSPTTRIDPRASPVDGDEDGFEAVTDGSGAYVVKRLPLGVEYTAVADRANFLRSKSIGGLLPTRAARVVVADLVVLPPATLFVRLVDLEGRPVMEAAAVQWGAGAPRGRGFQRDQGNVYSSLVPVAGTHVVLVEAPSYRRAATEVVVPQWGQVEHVVRLDSGAAIEGVVVDEAGRPVAGARVIGRVVGGDDPSPSGPLSTRSHADKRGVTDTKGRFALRGLPSEDVRVSATFDGAKGRQDAADVLVRAPAKDIRIVVRQTAAVTFRVVTPEGKAYGDASVGVAIWRRGDPASMDTRYFRHADGRILFDRLPEGPVELEVRTRGGHAPAVQAFFVRSASWTDLGDIVLEAGVVVTGRVVGPDGRGVPGVIVIATPADGKDIWLRSADVDGGKGGNRAGTAADGTFTLRHVAADWTWIETAAEGIAGKPIEVRVAAGMSPIELRVGNGGLVRCHLKTPDGQPAANEQLRATRWIDDTPHPAPRRESRATDLDGQAEFRLSEGRWRISLWILANGGGPDEIQLGDVTVVEGETQVMNCARPSR